MAQHYKYLIVGGGMAADSAVRGIRESDTNGSIGIISSESDPPYNRPPLTKAMWKKQDFNKVWRGTEAFNVDLMLNRRATRVDPGKHTVLIDDQTFTYERLLLATGGIPNRFPFGGERIIYYRYLPDYFHLRELARTRQHFAVVGGGFIGSEIAAALAMNGKDVTMLFLEEAIAGRLFPAALASYLNEYYRSKGVRLLPGQSLASIEEQGDQILARTSAGDELRVDGVVAGLGIKPDTALAEQAGLEVNNGILVNASMQTSQPDIYAAGDAVRFYNPVLGQNIRVEHEEHANMSGLAAGQAMAGQVVNYDLLPMAYSDLFELGYESVGTLDSRLPVVEDWQERNRKGVLYYLQDGRVRGVLLWNVWGKIAAARALIADPGPHRPEQLKGRIPFD